MHIQMAAMIVFIPRYVLNDNIDGSVEVCSISSALGIEILQYCTRSSK